MARTKGAVDKKPRKTVATVDWETLCKRLQQALNTEIAETQQLQKVINNMNFEIANARHKEIGYQAVISYLESKRGNTTV